MSRPTVTVGSSFSRPLKEDSMRPTNFRSSEAKEAGLFPSGPYPEREGEPDCAFYLRTGLCRFGSLCRFNHPPNRNLVIPYARMKGYYPERIGQPECQYYLKTGNCKFGATCKFHHPKDEVGTASNVSVNTLGYPLRPNEQECAHYLRTGQCKFGSTCKFHHPQPTNLTSFGGSTIYPPVQSPTAPAHPSFQGGMTNWQLSTPIMPNPQWQAPSSYSPVILPQGVVSVPGWNAYMGQSGSRGNTPIHGTSHRSEYALSTSPGTYSGYHSGSIRTGYYALQRDNVFPERPGQPECKYYMKTGDCKFGTICKFNHPKERLIPAPDCLLSPMGLPLRPGEPICTFYSRHGVCKFGSNCKFDHSPLEFAYNVSASASANTSDLRHHYGSSSTAAALALPAEESSGNTKRLSLEETREIAPGDDNVETK